MKLNHLLLAVLLTACATAKDDPNATLTNGRVIDILIERPVEQPYVYTPPPANNSFSTAAAAARNVTMNDTLRRPVCTYTIKTDSGTLIKLVERNCPYSNNACLRIWTSTKTSRPTIEPGGTCASEATAPVAG